MATPEEVIDKWLADCWKDRDLMEGHHVIEALDAAGYVIVPKEPTRAMFAAGVKMSQTSLALPDIYRAIIDAAPDAKKPPQPEG